MVTPTVRRVIRLKRERKFCKRSDLSQVAGWKHQDLVERLEKQRKVAARRTLAEVLLRENIKQRLFQGALQGALIETP